jgi:pyruvate,water dikinase
VKGKSITLLSQVSTRIHGLDEILRYLQMGDNVVFQVDKLEDYKVFVNPYVKASLERKQTVFYMRFANQTRLFWKMLQI